MSTPSGMRLTNAAPRAHTSEFYAVMNAFNLKNGDPAEQFVTVFGIPDSVRDEPWLGKGVKSYNWNWDHYYWPRPPDEALAPRVVE